MSVINLFILPDTNKSCHYISILYVKCKNISILFGFFYSIDMPYYDFYLTMHKFVLEAIRISSPVAKGAFLPHKAQSDFALRECLFRMNVFVCICF